ncbi:hypothetical protein GQR58_009609 [Nymphon striatum]|nr:hypothetical protein GQR58_009609 [Nymphon striatum]
MSASDMVLEEEEEDTVGLPRYSSNMNEEPGGNKKQNSEEIPTKSKKKTAEHNINSEENSKDIPMDVEMPFLGSQASCCSMRHRVCGTKKIYDGIKEFIVYQNHKAKPRERYVFTQDGAPSHTSKLTRSSANIISTDFGTRTSGFPQVQTVQWTGLSGPS